LAVFDLIRVPPPAASTITVRSLDMGSNVSPGTGGPAIVRKVAPASPLGDGSHREHRWDAPEEVDMSGEHRVAAAAGS
jgi:hypothetical protein